MNLPEEADLLHADFARRGDDLLVSGNDRPALIILDYFSVDRTPDLHTAGGAVLPAPTSSTKLAGPGSLQRADAGGERPRRLVRLSTKSRSVMSKRSRAR